MATELVIRFVVGGAIVSLFAVLGDVVCPKTLSGVFGAAPSVALATLASRAGSSSRSRPSSRRASRS